MSVPHTLARTARLRAADCDLDDFVAAGRRRRPTLADFPLATEVVDRRPGLRRRPAPVGAGATRTGPTPSPPSWCAR